MSFSRLRNASSWRILAVHTWDRPRDPTVYGIIDVEVDAAQRFVAEERERSGEHVTLTHVVGKAVAMALHERPDVNAIERRGRLWVRDTIDVFFQVAFEAGENLAGAKITRADEKSVADIARELRERSQRIRTHKDDPTQVSTRRLAKLPPLFVRWATRAAERLTYDFDLDLSRFGVPYDAFGSVMVTNVGGFGLTTGFAPLFPPARTPLILTMGSVRPLAVVVEGQVVPRDVLTLGVAFDHRVMDGYQAGRMAQRFREVILSPDRFLRASDSKE
ncbi:MAG: 2-oxo acid dehydrogenase subunit E2 [Polyangiaceae bacterium]